MSEIMTGTELDKLQKERKDAAVNKIIEESTDLYEEMIDELSDGLIELLLDKIEISEGHIVIIGTPTKDEEWKTGYWLVSEIVRDIRVKRKVYIE